MWILNRYGNWVVFFIALFICTSFIGFYPIYILDEARNSEAAREMLVSGDFIVPYFNGELRTDKPPLHYYFMTLGYKIFGVNALGARFFSGVFGALTILVTFKSVNKWLGTEEGFIVVAILLSSVFFIQEFHLAVPDPYLIFFIASSLFCFFEYYKNKKWKWLLWAYSSIGLGILTKGPIAVAIPGMTLVLFLLLKKDFTFTTISSFRPVLGLFFALVLALPWYYLVHEATYGEWTEGFFLDHNINRFNSGKEGHDGFFLLTPLFVILGLLPFSIFILQSFVNGWKQRASNDLIFFSLVCASVTILFFSVASTKLPNYTMPCYPFLAIVLATYLKKVLRERENRKSIKWGLGFLVFLSVLLPIGGFIALSMEKQFYEVRWVSLFLLIITIASLLGWIYYRKGALKKSFLNIAIGWVLTGFTLFGIIYPILTQQSPVTLASNKIGRDSKIIVFQRFDSAFPINFNRTFKVMDTLIEVEEYLDEHPGTFVLTNTRDSKSLNTMGQKFKLILEQKALFENHTTRIYTK